MHVNPPVLAIYTTGHADMQERRIVIIGGDAAGMSAATALHARMTVEEFSQLDLSYTPPFSSVWEPLVVAANVALR